MKNWKKEFVGEAIFWKLRKEPGGKKAPNQAFLNRTQEIKYE
jgi:hypothetical protein